MPPLIGVAAPPLLLCPFRRYVDYAFCYVTRLSMADASARCQSAKRNAAPDVARDGDASVLPLAARETRCCSPKTRDAAPAGGMRYGVCR
jgi:hypothetical protein